MTDRSGDPPMMYIEALASLPDDALISFGGDPNTVAFMRCVRDPRFALMARTLSKHGQFVHAETRVTGVRLTHGLCACCLEPLYNHRTSVP